MKFEIDPLGGWGKGDGGGKRTDRQAEERIMRGFKPLGEK